jgi:hypothetical protein
VTTGFRVREGSQISIGPFEGVPPHLKPHLSRWLRPMYVDGHGQPDGPRLIRAVLLLRIDGRSTTGLSLLDAFLSWCRDDEDRLLDAIHRTLQLYPEKSGPVRELDHMLAFGGSVWMATPDGLVRRVNATAKRAFDLATRSHDAASDQLAEAWRKAYGRNPDASDAWDHAIKAVEAVLIDLVVPKQTKPTLGHVVHHLRTQGQLWKLLVPGPNGDHSVAPLVAMLDLLWPNPDRHGNLQPARMPTPEEARAMVQLAVTIVQWARDGQIVRR